MVGELGGELLVGGLSGGGCAGSFGWGGVGQVVRAGLTAVGAGQLTRRGAALAWGCSCVVDGVGWGWVGGAGNPLQQPCRLVGGPVGGAGMPCQLTWHLLLMLLQRRLHPI